MVGVAVSAALVAAAVPVFASGAGPASVPGATAAISRTAVVVCPTGTTRQRSSLRIERSGRGRKIQGCRCLTLTPTGATGQTGTWDKTACTPCPAVGSTSTGSTTAGRFYAAHPILRRLHRIVRRVFCNPCPAGGATASTGSTMPVPAIVLCSPCPPGESTGSSGATTGSTGSMSVPDVRILPRLLCHRPPCPPGAGAIANSAVRAWFDCQPCPGPMTSMTRLFGRRGAISSVACNPCPATDATGSSGTAGAQPTILRSPAMLGCICAFVHDGWTTGPTGPTGPTSCTPPPCAQPLAVAGRGAVWRSCCVQMGATGTTTGRCSPPPICEMWGRTGATGSTGSPTGDGYPCPAPPEPCTSTSPRAGGQSTAWCGPCVTPQREGALRTGAHVCPMVAPKPGASVSA